MVRFSGMSVEFENQATRIPFGGPERLLLWQAAKTGQTDPKQAMPVQVSTSEYNQ
jgi:hypothetical protein